MGVTDLNMREATGFCRRFINVFGKTGIRATDGSSAAAHLPPLRGEVSEPLSDAHVHQLWRLEKAKNLNIECHN